MLGGGEALKASRADAASTSYLTDADGRIRRMLFDQDGLESFPLAAVRMAQGGKPVERPEGDSAHDRVPGRARHACARSRFSSVYDGSFPKSAVRGKIVVVGSTATSLQDFHRTATSGDSTMAGAEIQADAIQTALDGFPLRPAPWWLNALFVIVLGALAPLARAAAEDGPRDRCRSRRARGVRDRGADRVRDAGRSTPSSTRSSPPWPACSPRARSTA